MLVLRTVIIGTIFLFLSLIIGPYIAIQLDSNFPVVELGQLKYLGIILFFIGFMFSLYCATILFVPGLSRPAPYDAGGVFIIGGPYCYIRNPFMLGVILALFGEALLMQRMTMAIYALVFIWGIHSWVIFFEEPALLRRFGDEYIKYKKNVPRWFPRLRKYGG